jgi:hypothetical protein
MLWRIQNVPALRPEEAKKNFIVGSGNLPGYQGVCGIHGQGSDQTGQRRSNPFEVQV